MSNEKSDIFKVDSWKISLNKEDEKDVVDKITDECKLIYPLSILDTNKGSFNLFEKLIYDIAMFHFKRLNIEFDCSKHFIEYWTIDRNSQKFNLHVDCDESSRLTNNNQYFPILSTVTYFNEVSNPTLITNITQKNKHVILKKREYFFSFPKILKHISFNGGKYFHCAIDLFNNNYFERRRYTLCISLWNRPLLNLKHYNFKPISEEDKYVFIKDNIPYFIFEPFESIKNITVSNTTDDSIIKKFVKKNFWNALTIEKELFYTFFNNVITKDDIEKYNLFNVICNS